ncbi:MAG: hypothetical protein ACRYGK_17720 [Janthinobacterium lividum]
MPTPASLQTFRTLRNMSFAEITRQQDLLKDVGVALDGVTKRLFEVAKADKQFAGMCAVLPDDVQPDGPAGKLLTMMLDATCPDHANAAMKIRPHQIDAMAAVRRRQHDELQAEFNRIAQLVETIRTCPSELRAEMRYVADTLIPFRVAFENKLMASKTVQCMPYILSVAEIGTDPGNKEPKLFSFLNKRDTCSKMELADLRKKAAAGDGSELASLQEDFAKLDMDYRGVLTTTRALLDVWDATIGCHSDEQIREHLGSTALVGIQQSHILCGRMHCAAALLSLSFQLGRAELEALSAGREGAAAHSPRAATTPGPSSANSSLQWEADIRETDGALREEAYDLLQRYQRAVKKIPQTGITLGKREEHNLLDNLQGLEKRLASLEAKCDGWANSMEPGEQAALSSRYQLLASTLGHLRQGVNIIKEQFGGASTLPKALRQKLRATVNEIQRMYDEDEKNATAGHPAKPAAAAASQATASGKSPALPIEPDATSAMVAVVPTAASPAQDVQDLATEFDELGVDDSQAPEDIDNAEMAALLGMRSAFLSSRSVSQSGKTQQQLATDLERSKQQLAHHYSTMMNPFHPKTRPAIEKMRPEEVDEAIKRQNAARVMHGFSTESAMTRLSQLARRASGETREQLLAERALLAQQRLDAEVASCKSPALVAPNPQAYRILVDRGEVTRLRFEKIGIEYRKAAIGDLPARFNLYDVAVIEVKTSEAPKSRKTKGKSPAKAADRSVPWGHYHYHYKADPETRKPIRDEAGEKQYIPGVGFFKPMELAYMGEQFEQRHLGENRAYVTRVQMPASEFLGVSQAVAAKN